MRGTTIGMEKEKEGNGPCDDKPNIRPHQNPRDRRRGRRFHIGERTVNAVDIHSHILPGIDDGAQSREETLAMLQAAKRAGVAAIVATPHAQKVQADFDLIRDVFQDVKPAFEQNGIRLHLGFECHYRLFLDCEPGALRDLCVNGTDVVLLEFSPGALPLQWENSINQLQRLGMEVIIAHPERYAPVQADLSIAGRMAQIGCELQLSAGSLAGGLFSRERKCAVDLLKAGMIHYIASDAHCAADYQIYAQVNKRYGRLVKKGALLHSCGKRE